MPYYVQRLTNYVRSYSWSGALGGAVGWSTALQAGSSRVRFKKMSLEFSVRVMALGSTQPLAEMSTGNFLGGKGGWCEGLTTLELSCANCMEIWEPQPPGTLRSCPGQYRDWFTFYLHLKLEILKPLKKHFLFESRENTSNRSYYEK
jgi:hypothetical protein